MVEEDKADLAVWGSGQGPKDYLCVASVGFAKRVADPSTGQIRKVTREIGTTVYSTGQTWTGPSGGLWAEMDASHGEQGWSLVRGPGFGLPGDTALVDGSSADAAEEVAMVARRAESAESSCTGEDWPTRPRSDEHWKEKLPANVYEVLRNKETEPKCSGEYLRLKPETGHFKCGGCHEPLYSPGSKFNSGCGWPAFSKCYVNEDGKASVVMQVDWGSGGREVLCRVCGAHLGHIFKDGPDRGGDTIDRHCVNSLSLLYDEQEPIARSAEMLSDESPFFRQMKYHMKTGDYPTVSAGVATAPGIEDS